MSVEPGRFLAVADRIGATLCRDALWDGKRCNWLGWSMMQVNQIWVKAYRALEADVYAGTSGVALFLAELYRFSQDRQQLRAALGALDQACSVAHRIEGGRRTGFYTGQLGIAWALSRAGQVLEREELLARALAMLLDLRTVEPDPQLLDVVDGSAGAIPALLALARIHDCPDLIALALRHGEHLLKLAEPGEQGWSWKTMQVPTRQNVTGHSHGVAGIVTAMLELHQITLDPRFLQAATEGLRYEQSCFSPQHGNWPDFRTVRQHGQGQSFYMGWCHGAPGIGLSRLRNLALSNDNVLIRQDLEAAIKTTKDALSAPWLHGKHGFSLCHGASGNAELMLMAGQQLQRPELTRIAEKVGDDGCQFYAQPRQPWPCGVPAAGETANLMLGTAGIGHFYLRLHDPCAVRPILIITPDTKAPE